MKYPLAFRLPPELLEWLRQKARSEGIPDDDEAFRQWVSRRVIDALPGLLAEHLSDEESDETSDDPEPDTPGRQVLIAAVQAAIGPVPTLVGRSLDVGTGHAST